jgi:catechol 2,3-dioxygenase-like lactoylglutathione lyase family enzyme
MMKTSRQARTARLWLLVTTSLAAGMASACAPEPASDAPPAAAAAVAGAPDAAPLPLPVLHHVGLNSADPDAALQWYKKIWPQGEITTFAGKPAFRGDMYLIFTQVDQPPPGAWDVARGRSVPQSPFWHFGFYTDTTGLETKLPAMGVTTLPLYRHPADTEGVWRSGLSPFPGMRTSQQMAAMDPQPPRDGGFGYTLGPDGAVVEIEPGPRGEVGLMHVHFLHEHPYCAARWYVEHLGFERRIQRNPETGEDLPAPPLPDPCEAPIRDPSWPSLQRQGTIRDPVARVEYQDGFIAWYARQCHRGRCDEGDVPLVPSRGQVMDHVGFTYPDLDTHVERLRAEGVTILEEIHPFGDTRAAMIEDLDGLSIMLVERP